MDETLEYEVKKYEKYKRDIKYLLVSSGVWPNFRSHPRYLRNFLYYCSAFASGSTFWGIVMFFKKYVRNINTLTRGLGLLIGFFSTFIKVIILRKYEKDLESLNKGVSAKFEEDLKDPESRKHLLVHLPMFSRFFYTYGFSVGFSVLFLSVLPFMLLKHDKYPRMYPQVILFDYEPGGTIHWAIYSYEVFCGYYLWSVTVGVDSVLGLYSLHMVGEMRLLANRFRSLRSSSDYKKDIKICVERHLLLMESRRILERVFGFLAIWLAVTCAIALCALVFQITHQSQFSLFKVCYLSGHSILKLVQAYSYAWYGNIIAVESENCLSSIYDACWPGSGDTSFMSDVLIVLSQKPLIFRAMGCMHLRLDMFMKVVHTTASYFFLLQTLEEKSA